jgi:hypothetical protein
MQGGTAWEATATCTVDSCRSIVSWGEAIDPKPPKKCEWPVKIPLNQSFHEKSLFHFWGHPALYYTAVLLTRFIVTTWEWWRVSAAVTECPLTLPPGFLWSELMHHNWSQPDGKIQPLSKCALTYVTGICKDCLINTCIWTLLLT